MQQQRRLAAIMFTDMVGYSALTQENETLALELLEEHRQILRPFFPMHGGREVETIGDAFLIEFSSALEAVRCAIDIQKNLWERNKNLPSEQQIKIRIGIHLSDVVPKGDHVLGDGVNIAARIEPLAPACGICVSEDVARQVQNKIDFPLKEIEIGNLKNIRIPVKVYTVALDWMEEVPDFFSKKRKKRIFQLVTLFVTVVLLTFTIIQFQNKINLSKTSRAENGNWQHSIAVLPFTDLSPEKDQEYFCDGMTEQILTNLARLNSLKVIARTSVMKFKSTHKTIPEIGKELNVQNILEGSIRKFGDNLRITVQLIQASDGSHIWAEEYDCKYKQLFVVQDDISRSIADALYNKLTQIETDLIKTKRPVNLEAYEYYLMGEHLHRNEYWSTVSIKDFRDSEKMFLKAIELDPRYAPSYAGLVDLYNTFWNTQNLEKEDKEKYLKLQEKYISIAFKLDPNSADVNRVMGWVHGAKNETEKKFKCMKKAVKLDANDPENMRALGIIYDNIGLKNEALKYYDRCIKLDPIDAKYYYYFGNIYFNMGRLQQAKAGFQKALELEPNDPKYLLRYIWLLFVKNEYQEMDNPGAKFLQLSTNDTDNLFINALQYLKNNETEKALALNLSQENKMYIFLYLKMKEKALQALEINFERVQKNDRSDFLILENNPSYDFLRNDKRFQEIRTKHKKLYDENMTKYGNFDI